MGYYILVEQMSFGKVPMIYKTCDTQNIRVLGSARDFLSVDLLIASGRSNARESELTGVTFRAWWQKFSVAFPDRTHSSSSMVEVMGKNINIGTPNNFITMNAKNLIEALRIAEKINGDWLSFAGTEDEYVSTFDRTKFSA